MSVIDTATNTVTTTIPVGTSFGPHGVAVSPDGNHVYVTNAVSTVSVIDTATNTVTAIPSQSARGLRWRSTRTANTSTSPTPGTTGVGDRHRHQHRHHRLRRRRQSGPVAVSPDGKHLYVTNQADRTVSVVDTATNAVTATIPVGVASGPVAVAVSPDSSLAYVVNLSISSPDSVSVIDTATNTVIGAPIPVGTSSDGVAVSPDGRHLYVANNADNTVSVITLG